MIQQIVNFKVRLVEIPKIKKDDEEINLGSWTVGKKYRVYSIYSTETYTEFFVADDLGVFYWISTSVFRE